jgi:hypothetical protein
MNRVWIGFDDRQPLSANVLAHSITKRASKPVSIGMLKLDTLPITRQGLTQFTVSRYLVPWLCNYEGWALFLDSDMLVLGDIAELFAHADEQYSVMVVKNKQRFEWPSLMLFNCAKCKILTPEYVEKYPSPQDFGWTGGHVGDLPGQWNVCVNYDEYRADAKLAHYTQGVPIWFETSEGDYSREWLDEMKDMERICAWKDLMATSVHARPVLEKLLRGYAEAQIAQAKR